MVVSKVEDSVVDYYLRSPDFNGINLQQLESELGVDIEKITETVIDLVRQGRITVVSPRQSNPFIKMIDVPAEEQLDGLGKREPQFVCLYPTRIAVEEKVNPADWDERPFTKMLVLGAPQLVAIPIDLEILDSYEKDPRYSFDFHDFGGSIHTKDEHYDGMEESDQITLRFGVGYDENEDRVIGVYLHDLALLPARQQRIWKEYLLDRVCYMSEEYYMTTIQAQFPETMSIYQAIIQEQVEINKLFSLMGRGPLFRNTYEDHLRPRGFSFFVKPTRSHYNSFAQLMDHMLSDNMRIDAFEADVERFDWLDLGSGKVERKVKGSITLLQEWLSLRYPEIESSMVAAVVEPFREVRALRQAPAHSIQEDEYDKQFYNLQDELVWRVYGALNALRKVLTSDDSTADYKPPSWESMEIKSY